MINIATVGWKLTEMKDIDANKYIKTSIFGKSPQLGIEYQATLLHFSSLWSILVPLSLIGALSDFNGSEKVHFLRPSWMI